MASRSLMEALHRGVDRSLSALQKERASSTAVLLGFTRFRPIIDAKYDARGVKFA